jgi:hypothetical protein
MRSWLRDTLNRELGETSAIGSIIKQVKNKVSTYQLFSSDSDAKFLWASDSFTSLENINPQATTSYIDTSAGVAMLGVTSLDSIISYVKKISIDHGNSVGMPGNNSVITSVGGPVSPDEKNPEPQAILEGRTDLHAQVANMFDSQANTWTEWEQVYIPRKQKCESIGTAWKYNKAGQEIDVLDKTKDKTGEPAGWRKFVQWPGSSDWDRNPPENKGYFIANFDKENNAKLIFTLELDEPRKLSTVTLSPQLLGGVYPIVRDLSISLEGPDSYSRSIARNVYLTEKLNESLTSSRAGVPEKNYTGIGIFTVPDEKVKYITFSLEADGSYIPLLGLGHHYYYQVIQKRSELSIVFIHLVSYSTWTERLPNPDEGVQAGSSKGDLSAIGEIAGYIFGGPMGSVIGSVVGSLIGTDVSTKILRAGDAYDIFDGTRSAIGIKDIDLSVREYSPQSIIVSTPYRFPKELDSVSLISTDQIPEGWDTSTEWISYEISTDGNTWTHITPQNKGTSKDTVVPVSGNSITVRITMRRPEDSINESPVLLNYALKCLPLQ